jgi:hypothetical protein
MEVNIYENIFYVTASLAIIIIVMSMFFVFGKVMPLLRNLYLISEKIRQESQLLVEDVDKMRTSIRRTIRAIFKN